MPAELSQGAMLLLEEIKKSTAAFPSIQKTLGELTAGQQARIEQIANLDVRLKGLEAALLARGSNQGPSLPGVELSKFSFARAVIAISTRNWDSAKYEEEVFKNTRKLRDATLGETGRLGFLVPHEIVGELIPLLRSKMILEALGVQSLDNLVGSPIEMPKETVDSEGYWVGEGVPPTVSNPEVGMVRLRPHKAMAMAKLSNTLLRNASAAEPYVRQSLMKRLARVIQKAFFNGTGVGAQPLGLLNTPGLNMVDFASAVPTIDKLMQMPELVEINDGDIGTLKWAFNPRVKARIARLTYGSGAPVLTGPNQGNVAAGQEKQLLGYDWHTTNDLANTSGTLGTPVIGPWDTTFLANWGGMELTASAEAGEAFANDQTWIRVLQEVDIGITQPTAFVYGNNLLFT